MKSKQKHSGPGEIWLVHHTHVDIGYTEPQDVILRKHAEFIAQALDNCSATDNLPEGERFCWTCEVAWTVKTFLARYPERAEEFFRRVREGRIEVTALYLQLTDLFTLELLEETSDYAIKLGRENGFEVVTAMNDDVNGWAWGLPDLLAARGVRFMDTAINETRALGVRPRPSMFRWTGPNGGSLLFWHSHGYLTGNSLGLDREGADERVEGLLRGLTEAGYPLDAVELRVQGASHDNAPPGLWLCDSVRKWNATHPRGPRLRLVTACQWFEYAAAHWPEPLTEHRAAWPDWWADGNGSAAAESALVRRAQADLVTLKSLAAATGIEPPAARVERAREAAAFFCEHTWGAWCSTDDPDCLTSKAQWSSKAGFAYTAAVETRCLVQDALSAVAKQEPCEVAGILVFNPSNHVRSDIAELLAVDADLGFAGPAWVPTPVRAEPGPAFHLRDAETGALIPVWRQPAIADSARRAAQVIRFQASDIPALGSRRYQVMPGEIPSAEQAWPSLQVLPDTSGIAAISDRGTGLVWARRGEQSLGEVIYETIPGPFGREKLCGWGGKKQECDFARKALRFGDPETAVLPYGMRLRLQALDLPGSLRALTLDIFIYHALPHLDLCYTIDKMPNPEAEALYVAFPLAPDSAKPPITAWLDIPGAVMRPGLDQVPGTATDWHSIQHYFAVEGGGRTVVVASPDIPLVQVNGINTGKWQDSLPSHNGLVMSWVMNNYWFTNFPAAQGGKCSWRYSLLDLPGSFDRESASRFALAVRQPLAAAIVKGGGCGSQ